MLIISNRAAGDIYTYKYDFSDRESQATKISSSGVLPSSNEVFEPAGCPFVWSGDQNP